MHRAEADVRLAKANAYSDVYVLWQPYTFQDNSPYGLKSQYSWALGVTVPLPIYNRNQGGISRAKINVTQSELQLGDLERQAQIDVEQAVQEYRGHAPRSGGPARNMSSRRPHRFGTMSSSFGKTGPAASSITWTRS